MTEQDSFLSSTLFPPQLQKLIPYYLLVVAVILFYGDVYDNAFLYDDKYLILKNSYLRSWHALGTIFQTYVNSGAERTGQFYRPLQNLLYLLIYQCGGNTPFGFHLLNVLLHAANSCLVYALGRKLGFNPRAVFCGALIWSLHPIQTEAVTYMSATADVLYVFFCLLGVIVSLPVLTPRRGLAACLLMILGLLSKETAIIFPLLVMSCLFYLHHEQRWKGKTYLWTAPLWALVIIYFLARFYLLPFSGAHMLNASDGAQIYGTHIMVRLYTALATLPAYLNLLLWPVGLHMDRDFIAYLNPWFWQVIAGASIVLVMLAQIFWGRGRPGVALGWGLLWFGCAYLPQTGILVPVNSLFLEHWMYLPTVGIALGCSEAIASECNPKLAQQMAMTSSLLVALILGCATYLQNKVWHDPIVFYGNIFAHGETSARARNNLGVAMMDAGDDQGAMKQFQLALQNNDVTPETHQNIAALLSKNSDGQLHIEEEIAELNRALAINPDFLPAYNALADIYTFTNDPQKAAFYRQQADDVRRRHGY